MFVLQLYVTGMSEQSIRAIETLRKICAEELGGDCELEIVDVLERPSLAEKEKILVTPTLIRKSPPPHRRVLGDLSDKNRVLMGLGIAVDEDP